MELAQTPMSDRQRNYRQVYRERIATWYSGPLHVAIIYVIGLSALYIYASHMSSVLWWEWLVVPAVFLVSNFFEWWIHTKVMHRPQKNAGARAIYTRHTLMHHQFFYRHRSTLRRSSRLACHLFPAVRDDRLYFDLDSACVGGGLDSECERGLVDHYDHDLRLSHL